MSVKRGGVSLGTPASDRMNTVPIEAPVLVIVRTAPYSGVPSGAPSYVCTGMPSGAPTCRVWEGAFRGTHQLFVYGGAIRGTCQVFMCMGVPSGAPTSVWGCHQGHLRVYGGAIRGTYACRAFGWGCLPGAPAECLRVSGCHQGHLRAAGTGGHRQRYPLRVRVSGNAIRGIILDCSHERGGFVVTPT